jgi:hypothetical protein
MHNCTSLLKTSSTDIQTYENKVHSYKYHDSKIHSYINLTRRTRTATRNLHQLTPHLSKLNRTKVHCCVNCTEKDARVRKPDGCKLDTYANFMKSWSFDSKKRYKQMLISAKLRTGKRGKKTAKWEKSTKKARVRTGLQCHRRTRTRRRSVYCSSVWKT